jgi:hypothetical protein
MVGIVAIERGQERTRVADQGHLTGIVSYGLGRHLRCAERAATARTEAKSRTALPSQRSSLLLYGLGQDHGERNAAALRLGLERG